MMKRVVNLAAFGAAMLIAASVSAQNAASVVARAIEVHSSAKDAVYQMDGGGGIWEYDWADLGGAHIGVFDTYFTLSGPDTPSGQVLQAKKKAFTENACNFWCGDPLEVVGHTQGANSWTATPKPAFTGANAPAPQTGWTLANGDDGDPEPILITIEDIFIAEQKVLHHRPKPKSNRPWNTKISFDLLPEDVSDLKIEIVVEDDENFVPVLLLDPLGAHEYVSEYADWEFNSGGLQWGNPDALGQVVNGELVSDILQGNVGGDDFAGNDGETGGLRVRVVPDVPLTYLVTEPGHYTLRISGKVRGKALDGTSDQEFQVTVGSVTVDPCACD